MPAPTTKKSVTCSASLDLSCQKETVIRSPLLRRRVPETNGALPAGRLEPLEPRHEVEVIVEAHAAHEVAVELVEQAPFGGDTRREVGLGVRLAVSDRDGG